MSLAFPNTVLNTIVAEAIDELADALEGASGADIAEKVTAVVADAYTGNKQVCFGGDNYSDEWHAEAEQRGLKNLRTTPDALPEVLADATVEAFGKYDVLSERELESRYEVWVEQYVIRANIEAETTAAIARTLLLPAVLRHLALIEAAELPGLADEVRPLAEEFIEAIRGARGRERLPGRGRGAGAGGLRPRQPAGRHGEGPRGGGPAREARGRRPLAAAEVQRDPVRALGAARLVIGLFTRAGHGAGLMASRARRSGQRAVTARRSGGGPRRGRHAGAIARVRW